jgi:hypothetical protein
MSPWDDKSTDPGCVLPTPEVVSREGAVLGDREYTTGPLELL